MCALLSEGIAKCLFVLLPFSPYKQGVDYWIENRLNRTMTKLLTFLAWLAVLIMWGCAATVYVSAATYGKYIAVVGLGFPFCVAAVLAVGMVCLLLKPRLVWIPVVGLVGCCGSVRDYFPVNLSSPPPKGTLKVMSYNTLALGNMRMSDDSVNYEVVRYIIDQRPDIVCLQEVSFRNDEDRGRMTRSMRRYGYHFETIWVGENQLGVMARMPIADKRVVCHSKGNGFAAFSLVPRRGDTITVVCAHLESMHLSGEERSEYHELVKSPTKADKVHGKLTLVRKIATGGYERAMQADTLAQFIDRHKGRKLIVMGDFNDTPISYAHHQVCSRLTDCFRATGNGIGRSFNRDAIYVRIDNIFCSSHFKPYAMRIDTSVSWSDHYTMVGYLKELGSK